MTNLQLRIGTNEGNTEKMAVAEAALFSCHLERNDVESEALLTQIDFRTRNVERRFLIVRVKSVKIRFIRDIRVPDLQS